MNELFEYLSDFVFQKVLGTQFPPNSNNHRMYKKMVEEIKKMVLEKGHRIFNGGKLDVDGRLDTDDFNLESNIVGSVEMNDNYKHASFPTRRGNKTVSNDHTVFPKEIIKKGFRKEPYIFFGYNPRRRKYKYVCYNSLTKGPIFRKLEDNNDISQELSFDEIKKISKIDISILYCFLNKKSTNRSNGTQYMKRLQKFLWDNFSNYMIRKNKNIEQLPNSLKEYINACFAYSTYL